MINASFSFFKGKIRWVNTYYTQVVSGLICHINTRAYIETLHWTQEITTNKNKPNTRQRYSWIYKNICIIQKVNVGEG